MNGSTQSKIDILLNSFEQKRGKIDLSLGRITAFLNKIGNPQNNLSPVIHFAGTNGKGSTIAFLKAMIEADGKTCHAYTSPHLVRFNERINISGKDIENVMLLETLEYVYAEYQKYKNEIELTFFELTTVAAFVAFSKIPADYILLETGLGGRFDATNLIAQPRLTVITPISFDHMDFLGNTIISIATEKAGIIKPHCPCISAPQLPEARETLLKIAAEKQAPIEFVETLNNLPELSLKGEHQKVNASTAIVAAMELGLGEAAIAKGLATAKWPARMQRLTKGILASLLPQNFQLYLDGAHNIAGGEALVAEIAKSQNPSYLIMGMLNTKDASSFFKLFTGKVEKIYTINIPDEPKSFPPGELARLAAEAGINAEPVNGAESAIKSIIAEEKQASGIFICGSLYLAGHILKENS